MAAALDSSWDLAPSWELRDLRWQLMLDSQRSSALQLGTGSLAGECLFNHLSFLHLILASFQLQLLQTEILLLATSTSDEEAGGV
jgi:hypothetical protein